MKINSTYNNIKFMYFQIELFEQGVLSFATERLLDLLMD